MFSNFLYADNQYSTQRRLQALTEGLLRCQAEDSDVPGGPENGGHNQWWLQDNTDDVIDEVITSQRHQGENRNVKLIVTDSLFFRGFWSSSFDVLDKQTFSFVKNGQSITARDPDDGAVGSLQVYV